MRSEHMGDEAGTKFGPFPWIHLLTCAKFQNNDT